MSKTADKALQIQPSRTFRLGETFDDEETGRGYSDSFADRLDPVQAAGGGGGGGGGGSDPHGNERQLRRGSAGKFFLGSIALIVGLALIIGLASRGGDDGPATKASEEVAVVPAPDVEAEPVEIAPVDAEPAELAPVYPKPADAVETAPAETATVETTTPGGIELAGASSADDSDEAAADSSSMPADGTSGDDAAAAAVDATVEEAAAPGIEEEPSFVPEVEVGDSALLNFPDSAAEAAVDTSSPTASPTAAVTDSPTPSPTTMAPTAEPTEGPTTRPTEEPTAEPTPAPTNEPTPSPTPAPTNEPTPSPTPAPTSKPTNRPIDFSNWAAIFATETPTQKPTNEPTSKPTTEAPTTTAPTTAVPTNGPTNPPTVYEPFFFGEDFYTDNELDIQISEGLSVKVIARTGERVPFADGGSSKLDYHEKSDAAGIIPRDPLNPTTSGYAYVSNSELSDGEGGVYAIYFDANGDVTDYQDLLTGTHRNCGGGHTPWNTWISCEEEEDEGGQCWQIDPYARRAKETRLGGDGGEYESVACDNRDPSRPVFFTTEDRSYGALRRFVADGAGWDVLHSDPVEENFLVMEKDGTFYWTDDLDEARSSAEDHYPNSEGVQHHDGKLYFMSKVNLELIILDLDNLTYETETTGKKFYGEGDFGDQPDQNMFGPTRKFQYFTEDGGKSPGVYARFTEDGTYFTMFQAVPGGLYDDDETIGIALSPDHTRLYAGIQDHGVIFEITRDDGLPFE